MEWKPYPHNWTVENLHCSPSNSYEVSYTFQGPTLIVAEDFIYLSRKHGPYTTVLSIICDRLQEKGPCAAKNKFSVNAGFEFANMML